MPHASPKMFKINEHYLIQVVLEHYRFRVPTTNDVTPEWSSPDRPDSVRFTFKDGHSTLWLPILERHHVEAQFRADTNLLGWPTPSTARH